MASQPISAPMDANGEVVSQGSQINFVSLLPQIIEKFIAVMEAALILVGAVFLIRYLRKKMRKIETTHEQQRNAINLIEKITSGFIIVISITIALKIVGIDMTLLVSVAILGLSYGLQDIIKNYVAGILILFKAPFRIGDIVKIRDFTGKVSKMDFQSTSLETFDGRHITIYNSDVMTQSIVNFSNNTVRRFDFDVSTGYGSDTSKAIKIFDKILKSQPHILQNPRPSIVFKKFSDTGTIFTIKAWVQMPCNILKIKTNLANMIHCAFDEAQIMSPFQKSIEVDTEDGLSAINQAHSKRIQNFYQMPLFAEFATVAVENVSPEQPATPEQLAEIEGIGPENVDFDEPE